MALYLPNSSRYQTACPFRVKLNVVNPATLREGGRDRLDLLVESAASAFTAIEEDRDRGAAHSPAFVNAHKAKVPIECQARENVPTWRGVHAASEVGGCTIGQGSLSSASVLFSTAFPRTSRSLKKPQSCFERFEIVVEQQQGAMRGSACPSFVLLPPVSTHPFKLYSTYYDEHQSRCPESGEE